MTNEEIHGFRKEIDALIVKAESVIKPGEALPFGRELAIVRTKLQEAKMWAGKMLEMNGAPFPKELADRAE